jgi:hypothetical protein
MSENLTEFKSMGEATLKHMGEAALDAMEAHANRIGAQGAAVFLYSENGAAADIYSLMRIVGAMNTISEDGTGYNFIALAYSKIAESLETGKNSGNLSRPLITGEFGYQGSAVLRMEKAMVITSFSGSTGDIDLEIALSGIRSLSE